MQKVSKRVTERPHRLELLSKPYLIWLYIFAILPIFIMFILMFFNTEGVSFDDLRFVGLNNFKILSEKSVLIGFLNSFKFSILTTAFCLVLGYTISYALYKSKFKHKYLILLLLILPMWSNILIRILALRNIMLEHNIITSFVEYIFNLEKGSLKFGNLLGTNFAVIVGYIMTYLPYVIMPIYTALEKIEPSLLEASKDLGMTDFKTFWKVTFPLTLKGVLSGAIMVFLPCLSGFAIPNILGNGNVILIGTILEQFFGNMNYNSGSLLAIIMLIIILGSIMLINKVDEEGESLL